MLVVPSHLPVDSTTVGESLDGGELRLTDAALGGRDAACHEHENERDSDPAPMEALKLHEWHRFPLCPAGTARERLLQRAAGARRAPTPTSCAAARHRDLAAVQRRNYGHDGDCGVIPRGETPRRRGR